MASRFILQMEDFKHNTRNEVFNKNFGGSDCTKYTNILYLIQENAAVLISGFVVHMNCKFILFITVYEGNV